MQQQTAAIEVGRRIHYPGDVANHSSDGVVVAINESAERFDSILFDGRIISRMLAAEGTALALNSHKLGEEEIKVITDEDGKVSEISKTCSIDKAIGESIGIEKICADYSEALFSELDRMIEGEHLVDIFYERAFERLIPQGHKFSVVDTSDLFSIELDTVEDFNQASQLIPRELF